MGVDGDPSEAHLGQTQNTMEALLPLQKDVNIREASISEDDEMRSCEYQNIAQRLSLK